MESAKVMGKPREERWREAARFFDDRAERAGEQALSLDPLTLRRYSRPVLRRRFSKEFRFRLLGDLRGKKVLDVGCGDGLNAVMFTKMGAEVTGLDVSPKAVALARRRAHVNGVSDRLSLIAGPIERADLPRDAFDVVWGDGILHHVLDDLDLVMDRLTSWVKPKGLLLFAEPVNFAPALRRLRLLIPVKTDAMPGKRPLLRSEVDLIKGYISDLRLRHYSLFGRLNSFVVHVNYERSPFIRRMLVNGINLVDYALLSLPQVDRLGGTCVMYGHRGRRSTSAPVNTGSPNRAEQPTEPAR